MKYSFVLPAYKARFFKEALDSILNQTYKDFELIVVNDASPEALYSIVKNYKDSRIRYYVNENNIGGKDLVAQWNHCLKYANGEYIILASDDDVYSHLYLEKMDELVCKYPNVNVFRPRIQEIDAKGVITCKYDYIKEYVNQIEYIYHWMRGSIGSGIGYFIFHKEALKNNGGFYELPLAWGSDDITVINMAKSGIVFSPHILFSFRNSGLNITSKKNDVITLRKKLEAYCIFENWWYDIVSDLVETCNRNNEFYGYIMNNKIKFIRSLVRTISSKSSWYAIMCNLKLFYSLQSVSYVWGTFWIVRMILSRCYHLIK